MPHCGIKHIIAKYFFITEERYREHALNHITKRRQQEDPRITAIKMHVPSTLPRGIPGPSTYSEEVRTYDGELLGYKEGMSYNVPRRSPEIAHLYVPFLTSLKSQYIPENDPLAVEQCVLASTPDNERNTLDREFITSPLQEIEQRTKDCDDFITREKLKYTKNRDAGLTKRKFCGFVPLRK